MPTYLKFIISVLVAIVAGLLIPLALRGIVLPVLAAMMIIAVWLFPETRRLPGDDN